MSGFLYLVLCFRRRLCGRPLLSRGGLYVILPEAVGLGRIKGGIVVHSGLDMTVQTENDINITCCMYNDSIMLPSPSPRDDIFALIRECSKSNSNSTVTQYQGSNFTISVNRAATLLCFNTTTITNRTWWVEYIRLLTNITPISQELIIVRVPGSCQNVTFNTQQNLLHCNITFPPWKPCNRRRRSWFDTLLGGAGTGLGIVNSVDLETLANRLRSAGHDVPQALTINARWSRTTILPHQPTLNFQGQFLQLFNAATFASVNIDTDFSKLFNWTRCSLENIYSMVQKEWVQRTLSAGTPDIWRQILSRYIPQDNWISHRIVMQCTEDICTGTITHFKVSSAMIMCNYHVIPFVLSLYFVLPQLNGEYIDQRNNTHILRECTSCLEGMVCGMATPQMEPCLLNHSSNLCTLTLYQQSNFSMLYEVSPQHICITSSNSTDLESVGKASPFSGCLRNISFLNWQRDEFLLCPCTGE
ncbi:uncharacterized protein LOC119924204 [Tachyglossus aculeatus]|uniref:uncharacterized protein LOC119924204 n=1 Tax=Tachyglossus aculeatus TaxID=9261 RepID=UPI0018F30713|nr:uncharacterized protein LOC119924204 [Tachyglossus aculeatus]